MPKQQRSKKTFQGILSALPRVLSQEGYTKLTTEKIALEAEVGIGTLYDYFSNKEAVMIAYIDEKLTRALNTVEAKSEDETIDAITTLKTLVTIGINFAVEQREIIQYLFLHFSSSLHMINLQQTRLRLSTIALVFAKNKNLHIKNRDTHLMLYTLTNIVLGFQFRIIAMPDNEIGKEDMINELTAVLSNYLFENTQSKPQQT